MVRSVMMLGLYSLASTLAYAQEGARGPSSSDSGERVDESDQPLGPREGSSANDVSAPGQQPGGPSGLYDLHGPESFGEQLADGTIQIRNDNGVVIGHILSRLKESEPSPSPAVGSRGMETWVFEPGTVYLEPSALQLEVLTSQNSGVAVTDFWRDILESEAGLSQYVCVGVRYVAPSRGKTKAWLTTLASPTFQSYALSLDGDIVAWLLRGIGANGSIADVYAFVPDYQAPAVGESLLFLPMDPAAQFQSIDDYFDFIEDQGAGFLGNALYSAPAPVEADTTCTW